MGMKPKALTVILLMLSVYRKLLVPCVWIE